MHSRDVIQYGFGTWQEFSLERENNLVVSAPVIPGVFALRRNNPQERLAGDSNICYIGSAVNARGLRGRLYHFFHPGPTQSTNQRVLDQVKFHNDFEVAFVRCKTGAEAATLKAELLTLFKLQHGKLPLLNLRG